MPDLLGQIRRKAAHRSKEKQKLTYHIVVYSITGAPRSINAAAFTIERGDHAFESTTATQVRQIACVALAGAHVAGAAASKGAAAAGAHGFRWP